MASLRFALAGNPNSGKTTLFNALTGSTAHVGNWPGVTVDKKEGLYKKGETPVEIIDLPGIYSLSPYTPEEVIARNYILDEKPDCIINIVDATNLERNLYLTTQLLEIDVPVIIALNMTDVLEKRGDDIDEKTLESRIGVPVVEISALKGMNVDLLMERGLEAVKKQRKGESVIEHYSLWHIVQNAKIALELKGVHSPVFHAVKLVEKDEIEVQNHPDEARAVDEFLRLHDNGNVDAEAEIADARYKYIEANFSTTLKRSKNYEQHAMSRSDKVDKVMTHKWAGIPIFLVILFAVFHLTFSENFLYLGSIFPAFGEWCGTASESVWKGVFFAGGLNSPGVILFNLLDLGTGALGELVVTALESANASEWAIGLIVEGVLGGVFGVLSFLPQILVLFLLFSILEDSGYMARVAFILDRVFRRFGVSGRAFMPMIMGFGCSVPAMINTRTLADEKERTATVRVIPFFSCGAKLPILTAIAGGLVTAFGFANADVITYSMYIIGVAVAFVALILMRSTTMKGETPTFIMELPTYHLPGFKNLMLHLWDKMKHFIQKAFTVILASTIVIWFLSNFGWAFWKGIVPMNESILASVGGVVQYIFTPLGFGAQLGEFGWVFAVAAVTGLIAKENVVGTFYTLAACLLAIMSSGTFVADLNAMHLDPIVVQDLMAYLGNAEAELIGSYAEGELEVLAMIAATGIKPAGLISFIVFNMTTIPCFAAVAAAKGELAKGKFGWTLIFWLATSFLASALVYTVISAWWTVFLWAAAAAAVTVWIVGLNRREKNRETI